MTSRPAARSDVVNVTAPDSATVWIVPCNAAMSRSTVPDVPSPVPTERAEGAAPISAGASASVPPVACEAACGPPDPCVTGFDASQGGVLIV